MKTPRLLLCLLASLAVADLSGAAGDAQANKDPLPNPLDLKAAVSYALDHNFSILLAKQAILQEDGLIVEVRAQALPNVSAGASYTRDQHTLDPNSGAPGNENWSLSVQVTQTIYAGGGISAAIDTARFEKAAAFLNLKAAINSALLTVRTDFYNVILAREQIKVQEDNITLLTAQLKNAQAEFKAGTVSSFVVLQAQVALANAQPTLITARNTYRTDIDQLRQDLGAPTTLSGDSSKTIDVVGDLSFTPVSYDLDNALQTARGNRPELLALIQTEQAQRSTIDIQKAGYRPTVNLVGGYEMIKNSKSAQFGDSLRGWLAGVEGSWAIFDGGATRGKVMQARAQYEEARLNTQSEMLTIDVQVRQAYSSLQEADELVKSTAQTVGEAQESLRLSIAQFKAGTSTQLDVLNSQVALSQARLNDLQSHYDYVVALATMRQAIGEGDTYVPAK